VALADKLDTLRGCFRVGMIPTGSRDPFALRRAAQGVVKILVEGKLEIPFLSLIEGDEQLKSFFEERVKFYLKDMRGFKYDEINAAMAATVGWSNLVDLEARLFRIQNLRGSPDFEPLAGQPIENIISRLRPKVDLFFDKVLVNAPDERVRQNRLTLLATLLREFSTIADFSEIVTTS
jgi:glycyl-tRNA synthetase beta chain